jgi:hypothetical protein
MDKYVKNIIEEKFASKAQQRLFFANAAKEKKEGKKGKKGGGKWKKRNSFSIDEDYGDDYEY